MREDGFIPITDHQIELYKVLGTKRYKQLSHVGFNMAYAERCLNRKPNYGSYQADMMHGQSLSEKIAYEHCVQSKFSEDWFNGFIDNLSEESCLEDLRQRIAYQGLERAIRDNSNEVWLMEDEGC
jgi:hypothetical protein